MRKKLVPILSIIGITMLVGLLFYDSSSPEKNVFEKTFYLDATYFPDKKMVEISFEDKSSNTNSATLEILGMDESFQRTYHDSSFTEKVSFPEPPSFGWKIHPITLIIDHKTLGEVAMKTEIHNLGDPSPPVIYGRP